MAYFVKELFLTLQGEGQRAGRVAVFLRFTGCNLWSGRSEDRGLGPGSCSAWCDTDFVGSDGPGGGRYATARELALAVANLWPGGGSPYVVCTGGEPLLQLDEPLLDALHQCDFEVAIETNGTRPVPAQVDWICVSPKAAAPLVQTTGHELKLIFPQPGADPERFSGLDFDHFLLQPLDDPHREAHTRSAIAYCLAHPQWRLSLQTHKWLGIR